MASAGWCRLGVSGVITVQRGQRLQPSEGLPEAGQYVLRVALSHGCCSLSCGPLHRWLECPLTWQVASPRVNDKRELETEREEKVSMPFMTYSHTANSAILYLLEVSHQAQFKLQILKGEVPKNLWTYFKTTTEMHIYVFRHFPSS